MSSAAFEKVRAVFAALAERAEQPVELMSTAEHTDWLELVETLGRMLPALGHE
ncbi:MAG: hypothetical protein JO280_17280, partial [Mycobacteriaceae bacterium]|nr:hypothetical protein [Mycobacteriaceae bacterium]